MTEHSDRHVSPNMALDQLVARRRAEGARIVHLGFGESGLPVFPPLVERLTAGAGRNGYGPVAGAPDVRAAVAGYFSRRGTPTDPEQVVMAPGSKPLLMALQQVLPGDLVLPAPAWNTYAPQAELAGKAVVRVPIPAECGGVPEPAALRAAVRAARAAGRRPGILVLTLPDNPTGTLAGPRLVTELCAVAAEEELTVVSDEIYRDLVHDPARPFLSPAEVLPERTIVLTGLSKNLALGGWRIGAARFPAGAWGRAVRDRVTGYASEVWSTLAGPMQEVAAYAFAEPPELRAHLAASTRLHGAVARAVHRIVLDSGADCRAPQAGFYLYPDYGPLREELAAHGVGDSAGLQHHLLDRAGIAVLAGHHLGDDPGALRLRIATSKLYGETAAEQWQALESADPAALPQVARQLDVIERGLCALAVAPRGARAAQRPA
ncbi:pyridoxal phosphate-dependent aminotransferase [Streptomyces novaecaesareae]|uniref:pyridoxal phosphate-dependent aminotransferase n=1 Tax=Streptomyces novaecaesareae TaxID=68244 RepID=UPI000524C68A|nr:pyridoxal phosphate-dependent aminotransferase [Streptomyces novaecaesareae]